MSEAQTNTNTYPDTLLLYHEEEIMGEAYFYGLKEHFSADHEREKLDLLARVERRAAEAVRPLLIKHGLIPRSDAVLAGMGRAWIANHEQYDWPALMADMVERYPRYLVDFAGLEDMAPEEDRPALRDLTEHEVVAIDFAKLEVAGDANSVAPLKRYIMQQSPQTQ